MNDEQANSTLTEEEETVSTGTAFKRVLSGRRQIFTSEDDITDDTVIDILNESMDEHLANRSDTEYLYNYLRRIQPILYRTKKVNSEICCN